MDAAEDYGDGGQRINPPGQAASKDEDIGVGQEPEEDAERYQTRYGPFAPNTGRQPGHRSPEQGFTP
ncbi:MAG: hypothetical protein M3Y13_15465 [Armatimonadota bacterium]|nr:hypothetical protein [Armatimonadota bacterium]